MPWSIEDVEKHKKGLSEADKKKWVAIANSVLKQCQEENSMDCEGMAIRVANSKTGRRSITSDADHSRALLMKMKTRAVFWIAAAVLFLFLVSACGVNNSKDALNGSAWDLIFIDQTPTLKGTKLTVKFAEGQIGGSAGCNSYSGSYKVNGEKISIGPIAMTMMACVDPGVMEQEQTFLAYLQNAQSFKLNEGELLILSSYGKALTFIPKG